MGKNVRAILQSAWILLTAGIDAQMHARSAQAREISRQDDQGDRFTASDNPVYLFVPTDGIGSAGTSAGANFLHDDSFASTVTVHRELINPFYFLEVCHSWRLQMKTFADPRSRTIDPENHISPYLENI